MREREKDALSFFYLCVLIIRSAAKCTESKQNVHISLIEQISLLNLVPDQLQVCGSHACQNDKMRSFKFLE